MNVGISKNNNINLKRVLRLISEMFQIVLNNYLSMPKKIDSHEYTYDYLVRKIPSFLREHLSRTDYIVKGSCGQGNLTPHPWISIINKNITHTTQEGLYIVYLFVSSMEGFYLCLSQGITHFDQLYKKNKYLYAEKAARYFQDELSDFSQFSANPISLLSKKYSLGYGYEKTTILSKYYSKDKISDTELMNDLYSMISIYDLVYGHMGDKTYNQVIESILHDQSNYLVEGNIAISLIDNFLYSDSGYPREIDKSLLRVSRTSEKSRRFAKITSPRDSKIDYIMKAHRDAVIGCEGEKLALTYEIQRLINLGLENYSEKVEWVSRQTDIAGYDIKSYDMLSDGTISEIFIEVKTTTSKIDMDFFVSKNELLTSKLKGDQYQIFRIFDVLSLSPKFYTARGNMESNFHINPYTYTASYRWNVA